MLIGQLRVEHLDGSLSPQMNVLTEVDFGKASLSQQTNKTIVAKLLPDTIEAICHLCFLRLCDSAHRV
jgi:hypothetical protein